MSTTQQQLDALKAAINTGARSIVLDGQTVTYRSLEDMIRIKKSLEAELSPGKKKRRPVFFNVSNSLRG